jgi:hypothetical protein
MSHSLIAKFTYRLRSHIRFARYCHTLKRQMPQGQTINPFKKYPHPVTLGPEQISRFFTHVANRERYRL